MSQNKKGNDLIDSHILLLGQECKYCPYMIIIHIDVFMLANTFMFAYDNRVICLKTRKVMTLIDSHILHNL